MNFIAKILNVVFTTFLATLVALGTIAGTGALVYKCAPADMAEKIKSNITNIVKEVKQGI